MPPDPGGGGERVSSPTHHHPDPRDVTSAWAGGNVSGGTSRSFEQIITEEKQNRNILELHLTKIQRQNENGEPSDQNP